MRWLTPLLFLIWASAAFGANITGLWKGSLIFNDGGNTQARLQVKQNGKTVEGIMGLSEGHDFQISSGEVTGNQITVEAQTGASVLRMALTVKGATLTGDVFEDDNKLGTVSLKRQKTRNSK